MIQPAKPYFLIRIARQSQNQKKEKVGKIIIPETLRFMQYNLQCGEVVAIGEKANEYFPEVKIGYTLLVHHFVEGEGEQDAREDHLVDQDENFNYYVVSAYAFHRKNVETYAVWDGEKIIPNKDYIFLEPETVVDPKSPDEYIESAIKKTETGLFVFNKWRENRETKTEKIKSLRQEIDSLSKSGVNKPHVITAIRNKEAEIELLSTQINKRLYKPCKIAAFNPELSSLFGHQIELNDEIWMLDSAIETIIEFNGRKYIAAKTQYIGCINKGQE